MSNNIFENSLYTNAQERDELLKDKTKVMNALVINFLGFLSLYKLSDSRGVMKTYNSQEGRVRIQAITDANNDVTVAIKLAFDARLLPMGVVNEMTRLLALVKQRQIRGKDMDDEKVRDIAKKMKLQSNRPSPRLLSVAEDFINGTLPLDLVASRLWTLTKLPGFQEYATEFRDLYRKGQYAALSKEAEEENNKATPQSAPVVQTSTNNTIVKDNTQKIVNPQNHVQIKDTVKQVISPLTPTAVKIKDTDQKNQVLSQKEPIENIIQAVKKPAISISPTVEIESMVKRVVNSFNDMSLFSSAFYDLSQNEMAMSYFVNLVDTNENIRKMYSSFLERYTTIPKVESFDVYHRIYSEYERKNPVPFWKFGDNMINGIDGYRKSYIEAAFSNNAAREKIVDMYNQDKIYYKNDKNGILFAQKIKEYNIDLFDHTIIRNVRKNENNFGIELIGSDEKAEEILALVSKGHLDAQDLKTADFIQSNFQNVVNIELERLAQKLFNGEIPNNSTKKFKTAEDYFVDAFLGSYYWGKEKEEYTPKVVLRTLSDAQIPLNFIRALRQSVEKTSLSFLNRNDNLVVADYASIEILKIIEEKATKDFNSSKKKTSKASFIANIILSDSTIDKKAVGVRMLLNAEDKNEIMDSYKSNEKLNMVITSVSKIIENGMIENAEDASIDLIAYGTNRANNLLNEARKSGKVKSSVSSYTNYRSIKQKAADIIIKNVQNKGAAQGDEYLTKIADQETREHIINEYSKIVSLIPTITDINSGEIRPNVPLEAARLPTLLKYNNVNIGEKFIKGASFVEIQENAKDVTPIAIEPLRTTEDDLADTEIERLSSELDRYSRRKHGNISLRVLKSFSVNIPIQHQLVSEFKKNHPNSEILDPSFHGTGSIAASFLLRYGFTVVPATDSSVVGRMLGNGIYISNVTDKVAQYISDNGYSRGLGQRGYVLEMEAVLGKNGVNYRSAGLGGDRILSPEWCVVGGNEQLIIKKAYFVELVRPHEIKKYEGSMNENSRIKSFSEVLNERPENGYISHAFMDGIIPISEEEAVDFEDFKVEDFGSHVSIANSEYGPVVSFKTKDGAFETHVHRYAGDLIGDVDSLKEFLMLLNRRK